MPKLFLTARLWRRVVSAGLTTYYWTLGHLRHWRKRHKWMTECGSIQIVQMALAILCLGFGVIFVFTREGHSGSPVMDNFDSLLGPLLGREIRRLPTLLVFLALVSPHQIFGVVLSISSVLLGVAVYEWPTDDEIVMAGHTQVSRQMTDALLRRLLKMHLIGHFVALVYWALSALVLLPTAGEHLLSLWFSLCLALLHFWLYGRVNREYEKEAAKVQRLRRSRLWKLPRRRADESEEIFSESQAPATERAG